MDRGRAPAERAGRVSLEGAGAQDPRDTVRAWQVLSLGRNGVGHVTWGPGVSAVKRR